MNIYSLIWGKPASTRQARPEEVTQMSKHIYVYIRRNVGWVGDPSGDPSGDPTRPYPCPVCPFVCLLNMIESRTQQCCSLLLSPFSFSPFLLSPFLFIL